MFSNSALTTSVPIFLSPYYKSFTTYISDVFRDEAQAMTDNVISHELSRERSLDRSIVQRMSDQEVLANMGYKQEFTRSFSLISMLGFAFSILTCWSAVTGPLAVILIDGGPVTLVFGFIGVSILTIFVILSMGELASAFPVSGGQYSWILMLCPRSERLTGEKSRLLRAFSFICGWVQLAGIVCMGSCALYQTGLTIAAMIQVGDESYDAKNWQVALLCYAPALLVLLINVFLGDYLHLFGYFALYWNIASFVVCLVSMLACAKSYEPAKFTFTQGADSGGWNNMGMAVIVGLMQCAYGMITYDSPAHISEEMTHAARDVPRVMLASVLIGGVTGVVFIIALLFVVQNVDDVELSLYPLIEILYQATNRAGGLGLGFMTLICQFNAANSLLTEGSRSIFAFARDGAFPWRLNDWLMIVTPKLGVPVPALLLCMFFECVFIAILFGSSVAFNTVVSTASFGLYASYLMPIAAYFICGHDSKPPGYYNLSRVWRVICHIVSILYLTFCVIFFFFPSDVPATGSDMNYTIVAAGIVAIFGTVSWFGGGKNTYVREVRLPAIDAAVAPNAETSSEDLQEKLGGH